jgi:hypothetical protein
VKDMVAERDVRFRLHAHPGVRLVDPVLHLRRIVDCGSRRTFAMTAFWMSRKWTGRPVSLLLLLALLAGLVPSLTRPCVSAPARPPTTLARAFGLAVAARHYSLRCSMSGSAATSAMNSSNETGVPPCWFLVVAVLQVVDPMLRRPVLNVRHHVPFVVADRADRQIRVEHRQTLRTAVTGLDTREVGRPEPVQHLARHRVGAFHHRDHPADNQPVDLVGASGDVNRQERPSIPHATGSPPGSHECTAARSRPASARNFWSRISRPTASIISDGDPTNSAVSPCTISG